MAYRCSADTQYCVSSEMELLYNTCEMGFVARLMDADLDEIHDTMTDGSLLSHLTRRYEIWYDQMATPIEKSLIGYYFIHYSHHQLRDLSQSISSILVDSFAFSKKMALPNGTPEHRLVPINSPLKSLFSKKNILKAIQSDRRNEFFLSLFYGKLALYTQNITHTLAESVDYYYKKYEQVSARSLINLPPDYDFLLENATQNKPKLTKETKKAISKIRRVFNKSLNGLKSFLGEEPTNAFISGEEIKVEGEKFDYILKKSMSLMKYTSVIDSIHIPYDLRIHSKKGEYITKICVVFPGSPVLDQVLSLYLMVKSGREEELLKAGNFYGQRGDAYYTDPTFKKLFDTKFKAVKFNSTIIGTPSQNLPTTSLNFIGISMGMSVGREYSQQTKDAIAQSKQLKESIHCSHPRLKEKIIDSLFVGTGLTKEIKEAFKDQELSWDELVDFSALSVLPMPTHLDRLVDHRTGINSFGELGVRVGYDFEEHRIEATTNAPKKIIELISN